MTGSHFRFTPEVLAQIRHHASKGLCAKEIGHLLTCSADTVLNICKQHGVKVHIQSDAAARESPALTSRDIGLSRRADIALSREAAVRGVSPATLASKIVETVAKDRLWRAVLDE